MVLKKVNRTAITCWSPATETEPYLALGTVAGALDASFSSKTELEIFSLNLADPGKSMERVAGIPGNARFNRISWGREFLACGKENGEMELLNVKKVLSGAAEKSSVLKSNNHSGAVRGLHFNPTQPHLLASGATDAEILIWDLNELNKPYAPGAKSQRLEDVTCLAWNKEVPHILASGSSNGYTVVWDLRNRKELLKIPYPGGRKPVTAVAWNPDKPTQIVTCSDDDSDPVILMWDLRNASASEKTLSGHSKGILSMDWCPKDSDLLLSCGKDNRTIVWNASTGEAIGDLAHSTNWSFDTKWCPRNPDLCVTASFDGKVALHSIQNSSDHPEDDAFSLTPSQAEPAFIDPSDPFSQIGAQDHSHRTITQPVFCLPHPPKWLRRPLGAVWGFGGRIVYFDSSQAAISIKSIPLNEEIAFRADQLDFILKENNPETSAQYCDYMANSEFITSEQEKSIWLFLKRLFSPESRDNMSDFIGYSQDFKSDERLAKLVEKLNVLSNPSPIQGGAKPFSFYSSEVSEEADIDKLITKAVIVGDFEMAVSICLGANRFAEALMFAVNGSPDLLQKAQKGFFDHYSSKKSYVRVLNSIVNGDLHDLIALSRLDSKDAWKDLISLICTYAKPDQFSAYFAALGEKITDPSFSGIKDKVAKDQASSFCFMGSGNVQKLSSLWFASVANDLESAMDDKSLQSLAERFSLFRQAIHFQDPALALDSPPDEVDNLAILYNAYVRYAWTATLQGNVEIAWRFLEQVPINFIPKNSLIDIFVLRDRVYANRGHTSAVSGQSPSFPFEMVDVVDVEAIRLAAEFEEKQRLTAQRPLQAQRSSNYANQWNQPTVANQWSQPPVSNQWNQPPVANQWSQPPVSNQWNQPPVANQWSQPPVSNQWNQQVPQMNANHASWNNQQNIPPQRRSSQAPMLNNQRNPYPSNSFDPPEIDSNRISGPAARSSFSGPPSQKYESSNMKNPSDKACYDHLFQLLSLAKSKNIDKKSIEEAEKKLLILHSQLCSSKVDPSIVQELLSLCNALDRNEYTLAQQLLNILMTKKLDLTGSWIIGVKRIVDTLERSSRSPIHSSMNNLTHPSENFVSSQGNSFGTGNVTPPPVIPGPPINSSYGQPLLTQSTLNPPPINSQGPSTIAPPPVRPGPPGISHQQPSVTQNISNPPLLNLYGANNAGPPPINSSYGQPSLMQSTLNPPPINSQGPSTIAPPPVRPGPPPVRPGPPPVRPGPPGISHQQPSVTQNISNPPLANLYGANNAGPPTMNSSYGQPSLMQNPPPFNSQGQSTIAPPPVRPGPPPIRSGPPLLSKNQPSVIQNLTSSVNSFEKPSLNGISSPSPNIGLQSNMMTFSKGPYIPSNTGPPINGTHSNTNPDIQSAMNASSQCRPHPPPQESRPYRH